MDRMSLGCEPLRNLPDDGFHLPLIKAHSLEKIRRHNYYAQMFSTGMKSRWPQRAYLGLYCGAGRARIEGSGEVVETTAMSVCRLRDPFTKYIFVDNDSDCTHALSKRIDALPTKHDVAIIPGDVNQILPEIRSELPAFSRTRGLISFCFVDPFAADLKFETLRALGQYQMDFLILLMLGWDARVNFRRYLENEDETRIADLIDCPDWRQQWRDRRKSGHRSVVHFLLGKFDEAMTRIGYRSAQPAHAHPVMIPSKRVLLYMLVLYSKHELGQRFWEETLTHTDPQLGLVLD
ncbi:MAG: three-Cys-motif partner protein TcmP [Gemmatimonadales bacterium]|nr:three-Cys-motif partner protein TcmP [Gemmatimonadales bacterium]